MEASRLAHLFIVIFAFFILVLGAFTGGWGIFAILVIISISCLMWIFCLGIPTVGALAMLFIVKRLYFDERNKKIDFKTIVALWTLFFLVLNLLWLPPFQAFELGGNIYIILTGPLAMSISLLIQIIFTWTIVTLFFIRKYRRR